MVIFSKCYFLINNGVLNSSIVFQQYSLLECFTLLPPPTHALKEQIIFFLVPLPTLSNQETELHKEAVLLALGTH